MNWTEEEVERFFEDWCEDLEIDPPAPLYRQLLRAYIAGFGKAVRVLNG